MNGDIAYMERCLSLARLGLGHVAPNPLVGSVVVKDDRIIGEGYHRQFGGPHAEVNAIANALTHVSENDLLASKLFVNLEPCSHHGKTPPCVDLIVARQIPEVVIAHADPHEKVRGAGIQKLKDHGVKVTVGILEKEARWLNRRFLTYHEKHRPYVILKFAQTQDGFIAPEFPDPAKRWISCDDSLQLVHRWRSEEQAIMVGSQTVLNDNPQLTARRWPGKSPLRVVIDRENRLPRQLHVFDQQTPTLVFTSGPARIEHNLQWVQVDSSCDFIRFVLEELHRQSIQSVLVEGGRRLLDLFVQEQLWDEARIFTSPRTFGTGIQAPEIQGTRLDTSASGTDVLTTLLPTL